MTTTLVQLGEAFVGARGAVGTRCSTDGDCAEGLTCFSELAGERRVCTQSCSQGGTCPAGTECVRDAPHYDNGSVEPLCLRPCGEPADCAGLGAVCDSFESVEQLYCL